MGKCKILIVEDAQLVNRHLQLCLERSGYTVRGAYNAEEALGYLGSEKFDLALLDVMLNDNIDGIELGEIISKQHDFPIIYLTALADSQTLGRALTTRPYCLLNKPFKENELLNNIEVALNKSKFEYEIRRNRDFLATILDVIHESVIVIGTKWEILYANPAAESQLGVGFINIHGQSIDQVIGFLYSTTSEITIGFEAFMDLEKKEFQQEKHIKSFVSGRVFPIGDVTIKRFFNFETGEESTLLLYKDLTEQVEKERLLNELRAKNLQHLIEGQEMERVRFAKEIHDGLGQILNMVKLRVDRLNVDALEKHETREMVDEAVREVKRIANNLLPSLLTDFDLVTCIRHLANPYNTSEDGPRIQIESDDVPPLDLNSKINCFRIAQECISNAVTHGKASNINIQIYGVGGTLKITIEDNGIGFDPKNAVSKTNHHGLKIMKQRVESLQGEMIIESNKEMGTMIHLSIPMPQRSKF